MSTDIISINESALINATAAERMSALREAIGDSLVAVQRAAQILAIMERAGDSLSGVPPHMLRMLRRINAQQMLPEVMVRTSGILRQKLALLPTSEQARLLSDDAVIEVALPDGEVGCIPPQHLSPTQIKQVFGDGFIRSPIEQRGTWINGAPSQIRKRGREKGIKLITIDKERGGVDHYGHFISKAQLLRWLSEL